jgi:large subunit ribosomal protein L22
MKAVAKSMFVRTSPRKLRLVANAIRGREVEVALRRLQFINKRATDPITNAVRQALANAQQIGLSSPLTITTVQVNKGPIYKRWRAVSRGMVHSIKKNTSHILVELESQPRPQALRLAAKPQAKAQPKPEKTTTVNKDSSVKQAKAGSTKLSSAKAKPIIKRKSQSK